VLQAFQVALKRLQIAAKVAFLAAIVILYVVAVFAPWRFAAFDATVAQPFQIIP
jgi:hypothetical protein